MTMVFRFFLSNDEKTHMKIAFFVLQHEIQYYQETILQGSGFNYCDDNDYLQYSNCENNQQDERIPQEEMPNASVISKSVNQSVTVNGEEENKSMSAGVQHNVMMNGDGSQEFSVNDVKELMYHIQWLQTQLRQVRT